MNSLSAFILGAIVGICFVASLGGRIPTEGKDGQPDTIVIKGVTYVLVRAQIKEESK